MPDLSILIPCYNAEHTIKEAVLSVLDMKEASIEILIADDASKDGSREVIRKLQEEYPCVRSFFLPENRGVSFARNLLLKEAAGKYLAFLDSDDFYLPGALDNLYRMAEKEGAEIIAAPLTMCGSEPSGEKEHWEVLKGGERFFRPGFSVCGKLFLRSFVREAEVSFPTGVRVNEENRFLLPLLLKAEKVLLGNLPVYAYRYREDSASNAATREKADQILLAAEESLRFLREHTGEDEAEFFAAEHLLYGRTLILLKAGADRKTVCSSIDRAKKELTSLKKNPYFQRWSLAKKVFCRAAERKYILLLKILAKLHTWIIRRGQA